MDIQIYFDKKVFETYKIPESSNKAVYIKLNPEVNLPSYAIYDSWEFEYELFKKFFVKKIRLLYKE